MPDISLPTQPIGWAQNFGKPLLLYGLPAILLLAVILVSVWIKIKSRKSKITSTLDKVLENEQMIGRILSLRADCKTVLLAAPSLDCLPINTPVQIALAVAQSGKKCLLIDLDTRRNAAARVFDIHSSPPNKPRPVPTQCKNLSLWPAAFFTEFAQTNLRNLVRSAAANFDIILLNAPYLDGNPDRRQIVSVSDGAFVFCRNSSQKNRLSALLKTFECKLLAYCPVPEPSKDNSPQADLSISQTTLSNAGQSK